MDRPTTAQMALAKRLLDAQGASGQSAERCAEAAGQIYDKLDTHLSPLLGAPGVHALFARSVTLTRASFPCLSEITVAESSTQLRACLRKQDPIVAQEITENLFATFFSLISTFVGDRLTTQVLRGAWPTIVGSVPPEKDK